MEQQEQKRNTPWGVFIGLALILIIIVIGAGYSFSKRYYPVTHPSTATSSAVKQ